MFNNSLMNSRQGIFSCLMWCLPSKGFLSFSMLAYAFMGDVCFVILRLERICSRVLNIFAMIIWMADQSLCFFFSILLVFHHKVEIVYFSLTEPHSYQQFPKLMFLFQRLKHLTKNFIWKTWQSFQSLQNLRSQVSQNPLGPRALGFQQICYGQLRFKQVRRNVILSRLNELSVLSLVWLIYEKVQANFLARPSLDRTSSSCPTNFHPMPFLIALAFSQSTLI